MIAKLLRFALHQRFVMLMLSIGLIVLGVWSFQQLKVEAYPDISDTQAVVITLYAGHAAEEVEQQVTVPIERALNGVPSVIARRSRTIFGLSVVELTFAYGTDDYFARQVVLEKLRDAEIPDGVTPTLGPLATPIGELYRYVVEGKGYDDIQLREFDDHGRAGDGDDRRRCPGPFHAAHGAEEAPIEGHEERQIQHQHRDHEGPLGYFDPRRAVEFFARRAGRGTEIVPGRHARPANCRRIGDFAQVGQFLGGRLPGITGLKLRHGRRFRKNLHHPQRLDFHTCRERQQAVVDVDQGDLSGIRLRGHGGLDVAGGSRRR